MVHEPTQPLDRIAHELGLIRSELNQIRQFLALMASRQARQLPGSEPYAAPRPPRRR